MHIGILTVHPETGPRSTAFTIFAHQNEFDEIIESYRHVKGVSWAVYTQSLKLVAHGGDDKIVPLPDERHRQMLAQEISYRKSENT